MEKGGAFATNDKLRRGVVQGFMKRHTKMLNFLGFSIVPQLYFTKLDKKSSPVGTIEGYTEARTLSSLVRLHTRSATFAAVVVEMGLSS